LARANDAYEASGREPSSVTTEKELATMDGKIAIEEHISTALNNTFWDAKGEETRNGVTYSRDIERRLLDIIDPALIVLT